RLLRQLEHGDSPALASPAVLAAFCSQARSPVYDQVLDRVCPFGLGFMTALSEHQFSSDCSPASFGHSGYGGASFAFADPEHDLAVGVIFNGIVGHESSFMRRRALLRALYADLTDAQIEDAPPEPVERRRRWRKQRSSV